MDLPNTSNTLNITNDRVNNAISLFRSYRAPFGIRQQTIVTYPGGSYINDDIVFTNPVTKEVLTVTTNLAVVAPGVTLNLLSQKGFIVPALAPVDTATIYSQVNDFSVIPNPKAPPIIIVTNFIGAEMIPGSGRFYALTSPLDHFLDGGIFYQNGKTYRKSITATPFGNQVEWDEVTVVGN